MGAGRSDWKGTEHRGRDGTMKGVSGSRMHWDHSRASGPSFLPPGPSSASEQQEQAGLQVVCHWAARASASPRTRKDASVYSGELGNGSEC